MFGWREKRPPPGAWQDIAGAPDNTVLVLAMRERSKPGAVGPLYYPAAARIGWVTSSGQWVDFATGAPLDIVPDVFTELPPLTTAPPVLRFGKTRSTRPTG